MLGFQFVCCHKPVQWRQEELRTVNEAQPPQGEGDVLLQRTSFSARHCRATLTLESESYCWLGIFTFDHPVVSSLAAGIEKFHTAWEDMRSHDRVRHVPNSRGETRHALAPYRLQPLWALQCSTEYTFLVSSSNCMLFARQSHLITY